MTATCEPAASLPFDIPSISVVIPAYNMAEYLDLTLHSLAAADESGVEIIVVDDGSSDRTREIVAKHQAGLPGLVYEFRARDAQSSRARARNIGAAASKGPLLLFVDAGVIVPRPAIARARRLHRARPHLVCVYPVLGLLAEGHGDPPSTFREALGDVDGLARDLGTKPAWRDPRSPFFGLCDDDLNRLPAPWAFCWTCALSLTKTLFQAAGGFDEEFLGWGSEDVDLGRRLELLDADFRADSETCFVHVPHAGSGDGSERARTNAVNRRRLHDKHPSLATESMTVLSAIHCNLLLQRLEATPLTYVVPQAVSVLRAWADSASGLVTGVLGVVDAESLAGYRPSYVFASSASVVELALRACPSARVLPSLCLATSLSDRHLDRLVVTDVVRTLPEAVRVAQVRECLRIASEVILVLSTDEQCRETRRAWHPSPSLSELIPWASRETILSDWEAGGNELTALSRTEGVEVYRVSRASPSLARGIEPHRAAPGEPSTGEEAHPPC